MLYAEDNKGSIAYKSFDSVQNQSVTTFLELLENPEVLKTLNTFIDNRIATGETRILQRLARIEQLLGIEDYGIENDKPAERLDKIEEKIEHCGFVYPTLPPEPTKTEERACLLVQELHAQGKDYFSAREVLNFLKNKLPESCALPAKIKNVRKVKADVLEKAKAMYPNVFTNKKKQGRKEVRLILGE